MPEKGDRVELVYTDDPYTRLQPGDMGTVHHTYTDPWGDTQIAVDWDSGSRLSLIVGKDRCRVVAKAGTWEVAKEDQ